MALHLFFVSLGVTVNFHYCLEDHHLTGSFGDASELCEHCLSHHHHHHMDADEFEAHLSVLHFGAKCCCEDFNSEIVTDHFTFSTEKNLMVEPPFVQCVSMVQAVVNENDIPIFHDFNREKIPYLLTGRLKTIFFSSLKLNPLVF